MSLSLTPLITPPFYFLLNSLRHLFLLSISPFLPISLCVWSLHLILTGLFFCLIHSLLYYFSLLPSIPISPVSVRLFPNPLRWCTSRVLGLDQSSSVIWMGFPLWVWTWLLVTPIHQNTHTVTHSTQGRLHCMIQSQQVNVCASEFLCSCFIEIFFFKLAHVSYKLHQKVLLLFFFVLQEIRLWRLPLCPTFAWRYFPICKALFISQRPHNRI